MISQEPFPSQVADPVAAPQPRLLSLDVFRGFTLLGMVLVNSHPLETHPGLGHAPWTTGPSPT